MGEETIVTTDHHALIDNDEIWKMMADVHELYVTAYEKLNEARVAERELRRKMQEVYRVKESEKHGNTEKM